MTGTTGAIAHVLTKQQLAALLQVSTKQIERWRRTRAHAAVVVLDQPGQVRFSGRAVQQWLDAHAPAPARVAFGRGAAAASGSRRPRTTAGSEGKVERIFRRGPCPT